MNKNLKRIVALALAIGTISAVAPTTNINVFTTKAYAASDNDDSYLDDLTIKDENGSQVKLYKDSNYGTKVNGSDVDENVTYYGKTSSSTVNFDIEGPDSKYVRIFNSTSSSAKGKEVGDDVDLSTDSSYTTLTIKVYEKEPDDGMRYKDNDDYDVLSTYRVRVEYTDFEEASKSDNVYLERLSIDNNRIGLSATNVNYTYNVPEDVNYVTVRATPEDDDYDVTINDKRINSSDNFKKKIDLDKGTNEFEITVEDGGKERTYTLIINRGTATSYAGNNSPDTKSAKDYDDIYLDKLIIDGKIMSLSKDVINYSTSVPSDAKSVIIKAEPEKDTYTTIVGNDEVYEEDDYKTTVNLLSGLNPIKIHVKHNSQERVYTFNITRGTVVGTGNEAAEGNTSGKWVQTNGVWKYNDASGNPVKNTWIGNYYLKDNGEMAIGWANYQGNWYYVGSDGARKTGWQWTDNNWYYLDSQGKIQTGWIKDYSGKYYYLNGFGAMVYNTTIDGYKIGADGAWTGR